MAGKRTFGALPNDTAGAAAVIVAGALSALIGAAAIAIDLGSVYLARRELQGIADAAAMAAAGDLTGGGGPAARALIERSGADGVAIASVTPGRYARERSVPVDARFTATASDPNAVRVVLRRQAPLFFGAVLTGSRSFAIEARATASRTDLAAFSLGTRLAQLSGGLPNRILSQLAGTELNLSALDAQNLAAAKVDLLGVGDALRLRLGKPDASYGEVFDTEIAAADIVAAMADAAPDAVAAPLLRRISERLGGGEMIAMSGLIDLGPLRNADSGGTTRISVDAFSLLRSSLELMRGDSYAINLDAGALGLARTSVRLVGGRGLAHSPWMTVTSSRDVIVRTSQMRLYVEAEPLSLPLGLASIRLPIYAELAAAEARLADITCGRGDPADGVTLDVTPSVGSLAIADIDMATLGDLSRPVATRPALVAHTLVAQVKARADIALGGGGSQSLHFTRADIASRRVRSADTGDLAGGIASSLVEDVDLTVTTLGQTLGLSPLTGIVGGQLKLLAPPLDALLGQLTDTLGVHLGVADARVESMRCGVPVLVS